jgi:hypothetical protein
MINIYFWRASNRVHPVYLESQTGKSSNRVHPVYLESQTVRVQLEEAPPVQMTEEILMSQITVNHRTLPLNIA